MKILTLKSILILGVISIVCLVFAAAQIPEEKKDERLELMLSRIIKQEGLEGEKALYFKTITPLLFIYLGTIAEEDKMDSLYGAQSIKELSQLMEKHLGKNVIEFGETMFSYFEEEATKDKDIKTEEWSVATSEHFVFFVHPNSAAEADLDLVKKSAEGEFSSIASAINIENEAQRNTAMLHATIPESAKPESKQPIQGKIVVYLHQLREGKLVKRIKKPSMGSMSFGATILESGEKKGWGRLTAQIDVLYFNAFSLVVLHHEVAHAVLFLGSFNSAPLAEKPLRGESDLRKAFFAGYTPISPFLHEGIGDYSIYYHGFYQSWPILPQANKLVQTFLASGSYIPLDKLAKEDRLFRLRHHKEYSLEAASFLNYLIETHGKSNLKEWFLAGKSGSSLAFEKIYGTTIREVEKSWHKSL